MTREPSALERLRQLEEQKVAASAPAAARGSRKRQGVVAVLIAALSFLLIKGKVVLFFLLTKAKLLFAAVKLGPMLTTAYTMLLAAWAYAIYYGWSFAVGLTLLILVHEIGHGLAAARVGVPVGAPVFVPFFGAFIALLGKPRSTVDDAIIGAGGPIVGSVGAALCVAASFLVDGWLAGLLRVVGFYALVLNMFNLTPVWQLDGARMLAPVGGKLLAAGAAVALAVLIASGIAADHVNPIALITVAVVGVRAAVRVWRERRPPAVTAASALERVEAMQRAHAAVNDDVSPAARLGAAAVYFATLCVLVASVHALEAWLPEI
jgi:Zn-dependent protease